MTQSLKEEKPLPHPDRTRVAFCLLLFRHFPNVCDSTESGGRSHAEVTLRGGGAVEWSCGGILGCRGRAWLWAPGRLRRHLSTVGSRPYLGFLCPSGFPLSVGVAVSGGMSGTSAGRASMAPLQHGWSPGHFCGLERSSWTSDRLWPVSSGR